ncbi:hypothetical protein FQZ97_696320 [compost metagenome]
MGGELRKEVAAIAALSNPRGLGGLAGAEARHAADLDALAVRRVEHDHAALGRRHALQGVAAAELDGAGHARAFGVALGEVDHAVRHVGAEDGDGARMLRVGGFILDGGPDVRLERQQLLEAEAPQRARRDAAGDLRGLDGDGAAAAAGVVQRGLGDFAGLGVPPAAGGQHGGGQGFLQRGVALVLAPAALEQRLARGVDVQRAAVGGQVRKDAAVGPLGLDAGAHAIGLGAEAVGHGVLDAQGGEVQALQRAVLGRGLDLEGLLGREPDLPGHAVGDGVQVVLVAVGPVGQFDQHALREPAVQVELEAVAPVGAHAHAAAQGEQVLPGTAGQGMHLLGKEFLDAGGARQEK